MTETAFADGRPVPVADEHSDGHWFEALCHDYAIDPTRQEKFQAEFEGLCARYSTDPETQAEFQSDYQNHFQRNGSDARTALSIVDWHKADLRVLDTYQSGQGVRCDPRLLHLSRRCFILAHGPAYAHIAGAETPTELARQLGIGRILGTSGKATAHKCFSYFQQMLPSSPLATQRSPQAKVNMVLARQGQLKRNGL